MKTDDLISTLAADVPPVPRHSLLQRVIGGLAPGAVVTLIAVGLGLGFRADLWIAMHGGMFWIKWFYTGSLALCATVATLRLARPDAGRRGGCGWPVCRCWGWS
jgi:hypothetical protein